MKIVYTILFFCDLLLMVMLAYLFLRLVDMGGSGATLLLLLVGLALTIVLLVYFVYHYLKIPPQNHQE